MAGSPDDLGDAKSRLENSRARELAQRQQVANPDYAYAPRWAPLGNWRISFFDILILALGCALILMVLGMRVFGIIG